MVADHFSYLECIEDVRNGNGEIYDAFPEEHLYSVQEKCSGIQDRSWFADFANYLVGEIIPTHFFYQQRKK